MRGCSEAGLSPAARRSEALSSFMGRSLPRAPRVSHQVIPTASHELRTSIFPHSFPLSGALHYVDSKKTSASESILWVTSCGAVLCHSLSAPSSTFSPSSFLTEMLSSLARYTSYTCKLTVSSFSTTVAPEIKYSIFNSH